MPNSLQSMVVCVRRLVLRVYIRSGKGGEEGDARDLIPVAKLKWSFWRGGGGGIINKKSLWHSASHSFSYQHILTCIISTLQIESTQFTPASSEVSPASHTA